MKNGAVARDTRESGAPGSEWLGALVLAAMGVGSRLVFVSLFPTQPFSDFRALIGFGLRLRDAGWTAPSWFWTQFNSGLPMILSVLYRVAPGGGPAAARLLTAAATGLLGVLPFAMWRGVAAYRTRFAAGLLLALWPGQIAFSGVVAQDNWVLLPAVALACLGVRVLLSAESRGHPAAAGLLYAAAVAVRQEMLVVFLPLALAAAGPRLGRRLARNAALFLLAAGLPLFGLAAQRKAATGRFALTTAHTGLSFLGSFVPGASAAGWIDPRPWIASVDPALLDDEVRLRASSVRLALSEALRRPRFHLFRIGTETAAMAVNGDRQNLYWSLLGPEVLPVNLRSRASGFASKAGPLLTAELALIQGLFLAAVAVGFLRKNRGILVVAAAVALKVGIHAIASPMSRLLVPATALELLVIPLAATELPALGRRTRLALMATGLGLTAALLIAVPPLQRRLARADVDFPRTYRFSLEIEGGGRGPRRLRGGRGSPFGTRYAARGDRDVLSGSRARRSRTGRLRAAADPGGRPARPAFRGRLRRGRTAGTGWSKA